MNLRLKISRIDNKPYSTYMPSARNTHLQGCGVSFPFSWLTRCFSLNEDRADVGFLGTFGLSVDGDDLRNSLAFSC